MDDVEQDRPCSLTCWLREWPPTDMNGLSATEPAWQIGVDYRPDKRGLHDSIPWYMWLPEPPAAQVLYISQGVEGVSLIDDRPELSDNGAQPYHRNGEREPGSHC